MGMDSKGRTMRKIPVFTMVFVDIFYHENPWFPEIVCPLSNFGMTKKGGISIKV